MAQPPAIAQLIRSFRSIRAFRVRPLLARARHRLTTCPANPSPLAWAFIAITVVALGMRLWDLGGRTLHYDEILHAWYSYRFAEGLGYSHTPLTHGPFLFHGAAATFKIIGSSDWTVRLLPALFGTALVAMPYFLRRHLGNSGALATAVFLAASPSLLYFARFVRNDVFMAVWALALFTIMWHYLQRPRTSLLVGWTAVWALAYTTKESSFLLAGSFGLFLIIVAAPDLWRWVKGALPLTDIRPAGDLLIVLGTLSLPLWAPLVGLFQRLVIGLTLVNPDGNDPGIAAGEVIRANVETGAPAGGALFMAVFLVLTLVGISTFIGLLWDRRRWPWLALLFVVITFALFTSMFTNMVGFFTGYWGSLGYWIAQQPVERASQPIYYYAIGLSTYEFLVLIPALLGAVYFTIRGNLFDRSIVGWSVLTFMLFSFAGERMPWLLVGLTLPLTLVAGRTAGALIDRMAGARFALAGFVAGLGFTFAVPFLVIKLLEPADERSTLGISIAVGTIVTVGLGAIAVTFQRRMDPVLAAAQGALGVRVRERRSAVFAAAGVGALAMMLMFTVFVAGRASYSYAGFERPTELLVYSQTGQETSYASECIGHIAEGSGLGLNDMRILVGESDNFAWQWRWYVRDFDSVGSVEYRFMNETQPEEPLDVDVVLISRSVESKLDVALEGFIRAGDISHLWWFPNGAYGGITPSTLLEDATDIESWRIITDYFVGREYGGDMYQSHGVIYIAERHAAFADGCTDLRATTTASTDLPG